MIRPAAVLAFLACNASCASAQPSRAEHVGARPTLIVLITLDQFRGDYLERFGPQLTGGLARLTRGGAWFTNAHQDHAITETAPGHSTLLSGRFPRSTGIMANRVGVEDPNAPLIGLPNETGASPRRFHGSTLVDWLHARDSHSRALSVSMKDRGAILPIGRSNQQVYWYEPEGVFTTSRYYTDALPEWVARFNGRHMPQKYAGHSWTLLLPDSAYHEPDDVGVEAGGNGFVFPHPLPADSAQAASLVRVTPWMDELVLALALDGVNAMSLGAGPSTDVLAVSLSATDVIGHRFGPDSREMHDQVLRVDRALGVFLDSLFRLRDSSRVAVVLAADHGVGTIPELVSDSVPPPTRVSLDAVVIDVMRKLQALHIRPDAFDLDQQVVVLDRGELRQHHVNVDSLLAAFAVAARKQPGVRRVDRLEDLWHGDTVHDAIARRWTHQFPSDSPVELVVTLSPFSTWGGNTASHGSPYDYDSHIPLIFYGAAFKSGRNAAFVRSVDIAPTLADLVGVPPTQPLDGVVLKSAFKE